MMIGYEEIYRMPEEKDKRNIDEQKANANISEVERKIQNGEIDLSKIK